MGLVTLQSRMCSQAPLYPCTGFNPALLPAQNMTLYLPQTSQLSRPVLLTYLPPTTTLLNQFALFHGCTIISIPTPTTTHTPLPGWQRLRIDVPGIVAAGGRRNMYATLTPRRLPALEVHTSSSVSHHPDKPVNIFFFPTKSSFHAGISSPSPGVVVIRNYYANLSRYCVSLSWLFITVIRVPLGPQTNETTFQFNFLHNSSRFFIYSINYLKREKKRNCKK